MRRDGLCSLGQFRVGEIRRGMRHKKKGIIREAPLAGHGPPRHVEGLGYDGGGRHARLLHEDAVEHTAR